MCKQENGSAIDRRNQVCLEGHTIAIDHTELVTEDSYAFLLSSECTSHNAWAIVPKVRILLNVTNY
jgi:hypothetical protein